MGETTKIELIVRELQGLMYEDPSCDFEHVWNCALVQGIDAVESYKK